MPMKCIRAGFTLIELLVVIGLIAVIAGVLGLSLGRGNSGTSLQGAQSTSSALIAGARAQAATSLNNSGVFINVSPDSDNFLRECYIAVNNGAAWVARGDPVLLPRGIFLVPANTAFPIANVEFGTDGGSWSERSSGFPAAALSLKASDGSTNINSESYRLLVSFTPRGTTSSTMSQIVFAAGERVSGSKVLFNNASAVRGMTISNYGIATLINDVESF
jgi:prepilin-type N-terminal cleavage/methylation domain-containing protein